MSRDEGTVGEVEEAIIAGNEAQEGPDPEQALPPASGPDDISPEPPNEEEVLAEEEETPSPSTVHPSAAAGTTEEDEEVVNGRKEYGEYFIGMWSDLPNFGCPYCPFSVLGSRHEPTTGNGEVELHVLTQIDSGEPRHLAALTLKEG